MLPRGIDDARRIDLETRLKGAISVGSDADFVIVDLDRTRRVAPEMIHSSAGWSIWEGKELKGWPTMTILRGNVIMEWPEGEPRARIAEGPGGRYIPRKPGRQLYPV